MRLFEQFAMIEFCVIKRINKTNRQTHVRGELGVERDREHTHAHSRKKIKFNRREFQSICHLFPTNRYRNLINNGFISFEFHLELHFGWANPFANKYSYMIMTAHSKD